MRGSWAMRRDAGGAKRTPGRGPVGSALNLWLNSAAAAFMRLVGHGWVSRCFASPSAGSREITDCSSDRQTCRDQAGENSNVEQKSVRSPPGPSDLRGVLAGLPPHYL